MAAAGLDDRRQRRERLLWSVSGSARPSADGWRAAVSKISPGIRAGDRNRVVETRGNGRVVARRSGAVVAPRLPPGHFYPAPKARVNCRGRMARKISCSEDSPIYRHSLVEMVEGGMSQRGIAEAFGVSQSTVRYYLSKYGLKVKRKPSAVRVEPHPGKCSLCEREMAEKDRRRRRCSPCEVRVRRYLNKVKSVEYLGGKCSACGFCGSFAAFDFHHVRAKSFPLAENLNRPWSILREELDKCVLLCRNCHAIEHSKYDETQLMVEALDIQRRSYFSSL